MGKKAQKAKSAQGEPDHGIFDRSYDFIKDVSVRIKTEAARTIKTTNLNIEIGLKKRNLRKKYSDLGEAAFQLIRANKLRSEPLMELYQEALNLDKEIVASEELIKQLLRSDEELRRKVEESAKEHDRHLAAEQKKAAAKPASKPAAKAKKKATKKVAKKAKPASPDGQSG